MNNLLQDVSYGLRMLAKRPGLTAVAVLAMALGIGANTSIFTTVNAMLLHPLPFPHLDRIVTIWETVPAQNEDHAAVAPANFRDWTEQSHPFQQLAAGHGWEVNLTGVAVPERVDGFQVTPDFLPLLGMGAKLGRQFNEGDFAPGHTSVVVVSYGFWQQRLGGNPQVIGSPVRLNGLGYTVVGVMPEDFEYPMGVEVWAPLDLAGSPGADRTNHYLQVMGRLKAGVSLEQAQAELQAIAGRLAQQFPATNAAHSVRLVKLVNDMLQGSRQFILVLMGAAGFVLLLACANVANLQLVQGSARQKEIAVRVALGAGRGRIARQVLIESVLQSSLGALLGLVMAYADMEWRSSSIPAFVLKYVPGVRHMHIDGSVLAFTAALAAGAGILAGLGFAWHATRVDLNETLKESARGGGASASSHRLRGVLVVTEFVLALVLLVGAGLMVQGFHHLQETNLGCDRTNVLTFQIALPESKYREESQTREFYNKLVERLGALPGVERAAAVATLPGQFNWTTAQYRAEGQAPPAPGEMRSATQEVATPEIFRLLRIPLIQGRTLGSQDGPDSAPVVVLNSSFARRLWPGENALGKRIHFGPEGSGVPWRTVVGVVGDVKPMPFDHSAPPMAYFPLDQLTQRSLSVALRTQRDPMSVAAAARAQVQALDGEQPVYDVRPLEKILDDELSGVKVSAEMMMVYAFIALVLSASGIFALMAYSVAQRTHEIGVRMALGACPRDVFRLVVGRAFFLALVGLAIGVPAAAALARTLSSVLLGVIQVDVGILAGFATLLLSVAVVAAYLPARRAAKVSPLDALRYE